jgi:putative methyltransferase (TIGR04325 family)
MRFRDMVVARANGSNIMLRASAKLARDTYRFLAFQYSHFRGVYESFDQAKGAASRTTRIGYNHADLAGRYRAELFLDLDNSEYPVLYHLHRILTDGCTVLDFGGNVGVHYLRYRKYLDLDRIKWIVSDVPEITKVGRATCAGIPNVAFVNELGGLDADRIDVLLASNSLQYVESHDSLLPGLIAKGLKPRHILIDQLPLYDGPRFVTLQNGGLVRYPQYVFNRAEYLTAISKLDYELVDSWDCRNFSCVVPFHSDRSVRAYTGLYFSAKRANAATI